MFTLRDNIILLLLYIACIFNGHYCATVGSIEKSKTSTCDNVIQQQLFGK